MSRVAISTRTARALLLCLAASTAHALSPRLAIRQYQHTSWTEHAGQPLPAVESIAQADDGYLWLATGAGGLRFDGVRFSEWTAPPARRVEPSRIRAIASARDGAVWIETEVGLSRVERSRTRHYPFDWSRSVLNALFDDPSGAVWMSVESQDGSYVQTLAPADGSVRPFGRSEGLPAEVLSMAPDGAAFWLGIDGGICRWIPSAPAICYPVAGGVLSVAPAGPGTVFAATASVIYRLSAGRITTVVPALPHASILRGRLLVDRDGVLWVGTTGGLLRVNGGAVETFTRKDGLSGEFLHDLLEDSEGDIWVSTNNGIDRFRNPRVLHFTTMDGLSAELTSVVKAARDGSIWVGAYGSGLSRIRSGSVTGYSVAEGRPSKAVTAIEEDRGGRIWVASGAQIAYLHGGRFVKVDAPPSMQSVFSLAHDAHGAIWVAANAIWRIAGGVARPVDAPAPSDIFRLLPARDGSVWLGSFAGGVRALSASMVDVSPPLDGLGPGSAPRQILEDRGVTWVAMGGVLSRIRGGKVTRWGAAQGLAAGDIYGFTLDQRGNLWMTTVSAVVRVPLADLEKSPDGDPQPARFTRYDENDGVRPVTRGGMSSPRITTATDGRIWFCERDGVGIIDPDLLTGNSVRPPVVIEQLTADGVALDALRPSFRGQQLRITYTATSLMAPERVRFRYRLEPAAGWTDAEGRREITFVNLAPGNYRFRVTACNLDAVCNETGAAVDFRVMPLYYQTLWFRLGLAGAACGIVWVSYRFRMRRVDARYRLIAQERARLTREIHDSLLQGFAGVVLQLDAASRQFASHPALSKERLDRALEQADQSLREARQMLLDMRLPILEGRTLAEVLAEAGNAATRGTSIAFHLRIKGKEKPLPYPAQAALFLIGREAIINAVNHATPGRITLHLNSTDKECRLLVEDDGCGFDLEAAKRKSGHLGVRGMAERAREVGAQFRLETEPGAGTRVHVVVPRKRSSM
jgi:signal transduction histidine kinase/ligand-binding sensor domain-containing protein